MLLTVGIIGGAHGLRGEVRVAVRSDDPQSRFYPGARLYTEPAAAGPLTVRSWRRSANHNLLAFAEVPDRTGAEALQGTKLLIDTAETGDDGGQDDAYYLHELVGLAVVGPQGQHLGEVTGLNPSGAQDLLEIRNNEGGTTLLPFVSALVPEVDLEGGRLHVDPPGGLFPDLGQEA